VERQVLGSKGEEGTTEEKRVGGTLRRTIRAVKKKNYYRCSPSSQKSRVNSGVQLCDGESYIAFRGGSANGERDKEGDRASISENHPEKLVGLAVSVKGKIKQLRKKYSLST